MSNFHRSRLLVNRRQHGFVELEQLDKDGCAAWKRFPDQRTMTRNGVRDFGSFDLLPCRYLSRHVNQALLEIAFGGVQFGQLGGALLPATAQLHHNSYITTIARGKF